MLTKTWATRFDLCMYEGVWVLPVWISFLFQPTFTVKYAKYNNKIITPASEIMFKKMFTIRKHKLIYFSYIVCLLVGHYTSGQTRTRTVLRWCTIYYVVNTTGIPLLSVFQLFLNCVWMTIFAVNSSPMNALSTFANIFVTYDCIKLCFDFSLIVYKQVCLLHVILSEINKIWTKLW